MTTRQHVLNACTELDVDLCDLEDMLFESELAGATGSGCSMHLSPGHPNYYPMLLEMADVIRDRQAAQSPTASGYYERMRREALA